MATSKVLQTPRIIEIIGSTVRIAHPDISNNARTFLRSGIAAAGVTATVGDNNTFTDADQILIGEIGDSITEAILISGAVSRGSSITLAAGLVFGHEIDAPFTRLNERSFKIYGAATDGGVGTIIASVGAGGKPIQWNRPFSEWTLITTDTAYAYYYATFYDGTTESSASAYVPAAGVSYATVESVLQEASAMTNTPIDKSVTREQCVIWAQACNDEIAQFAYQDPVTGQIIKKDWSHEQYEDTTSISVTQGELRYALSSLAYAPKYPNSDKSMINVRLGANKPLDKVDTTEMDTILHYPRCLTTATVLVGDTSISVDSTAEFSDSGSAWLGSNQFTYTAKTATSFTGVPASGTGSITTAISTTGRSVIQGLGQGTARKYAIFNGYITLNLPPDTTVDGVKLKVKFWRAMPRLTAASSPILVPFTNAFKYFIAAMMEMRKGKGNMSGTHMTKFKEIITQNAVADQTAMPETQTYYNYGPPVEVGDDDDVDNFLIVA